MGWPRCFSLASRGVASLFATAASVVPLRVKSGILDSTSSPPLFLPCCCLLTPSCVAPPAWCAPPTSSLPLGFPLPLFLRPLPDPPRDLRPAAHSLERRRGRVGGDDRWISHTVEWRKAWCLRTVRYARGGDLRPTGASQERPSFFWGATMGCTSAEGGGHAAGSGVSRRVSRSGGLGDARTNRFTANLAMASTTPCPSTPPPLCACHPGRSHKDNELGMPTRIVMPVSL